MQLSISHMSFTKGRRDFSKMHISVLPWTLIPAQTQLQQAICEGYCLHGFGLLQFWGELSEQ